MSTRVNHHKVTPALANALSALSMEVAKTSIDPALKHLIDIRVSQLNGCTFCLDMHSKEAKIAGERELRIHVGRQGATFPQAFEYRAGALGVQLAGPAYYFGEYYPKPTIGDPLRPIEPEDILRADRMMYVASGFALAFGCAIRGFLG